MNKALGKIKIDRQKKMSVFLLTIVIYKGDNTEGTTLKGLRQVENSMELI